MDRLSFKERLGPKDLKVLYGEGLMGKEGWLIDAIFIEASRQRNTPEQKNDIKEGKKPKPFGEKPHCASQKDTDARWIRKPRVDAASKFILSKCCPSF